MRSAPEKIRPAKYAEVLTDLLPKGIETEDEYNSYAEALRKFAEKEKPTREEGPSPSLSPS